MRLRELLALSDCREQSFMTMAVIASQLQDATTRDIYDPMV
jgi:hypothetical protein